MPFSILMQQKQSSYLNYIFKIFLDALTGQNVVRVGQIFLWNSY